MFNFTAVEKQNLGGGSKLSPRQIALSKTAILLTEEVVKIMGVHPGQGVEIHVDPQSQAIKLTPVSSGGFLLSDKSIRETNKGKRYTLYSPVRVRRVMKPGIYTCVDDTDNIFVKKENQYV